MPVRRKLNIPKAHGRIRLRITADDYYKLYINGKFVGQGLAQGYPFYYYWNEYDVTRYITEDKNDILVDVYYQGLINRAYNSGNRRMGMVAEVFDNDECILSTDSEWEYAISKAFTISHTIGYNTIFVENIDSRVKTDE